MSEQADDRPNVNYGPEAMAHENEILRSVVGSGVHGVAIAGIDDHDEMGVYIEPPGYVIGLYGWNYLHNKPAYGDVSPADRHTFRTQPEGARSGPGDTDLVMYGLRKYLRLACKGNPTALLPLFAPESDLVVQTPLGMDLRRLRLMFLTKGAVRRFVGYMDSQHERMLGGGKRNRVPNRPELVEAHGWDTKYGSHALRLAYEGHQIATARFLTLPMRPGEREAVLAVKRGEVSQEEVSEAITTLRARTIAAIEDPACVLPEAPDWDTLSAWTVDAYQRHWESA